MRDWVVSTCSVCAGYREDNQILRVLCRLSRRFYIRLRGPVVIERGEVEDSLRQCRSKVEVVEWPDNRRPTRESYPEYRKVNLLEVFAKICAQVRQQSTPAPPCFALAFGAERYLDRHCRGCMRVHGGSLP